MSNSNVQYTLESRIQPLAIPLGESQWTSTSQLGFEHIKDLCSERPLAGGLIYVSILECSGRRFRLTKPLCIQESYEQGVWSRRFDSLAILAYGQSREEAMETFCEEFACCWDQIACEQDDNLTADAQDMKRELLDLVKGDVELLE